jgi:ubiquinone/menaquinone biosynthesis C-methylase UbiE
MPAQIERHTRERKGCQKWIFPVASLDLARGTGEMLCTWARDHRVSGLGVDISSVFIAAARARADEMDVADRVTFVHGDASGYVADEPVGIVSCVAATWIGGGVACRC